MKPESMDRRTLIGAAGATAVALAMFRAPAQAAARYKVAYSEGEWRRRLGPQRFAVLRQAATERPYSSGLNKEHRSGRFVCAGCDQPVFNSATKFESGTGWPSFYRALPGAVVTRGDRSLLIERTEVLCSRCGGHLGHLFKDGPKPTGLRYCMNGLALKFLPA